MRNWSAWGEGGKTRRTRDVWDRDLAHTWAQTGSQGAFPIPPHYVSVDSRCFWIQLHPKTDFHELCAKNSRRAPKSSNESHTMLLSESAARICTLSAQSPCSVTQHAGALTLQQVSGKALFVSGFSPAELCCEMKILIFISLCFYYLFNVMVNQVPMLLSLHPTWNIHLLSKEQLCFSLKIN